MFLLHIALEAPLAIQGMFSPQGLPFLDMTNSTLVILKVETFQSNPTAGHSLTFWVWVGSSMQRFPQRHVSPHCSYSLFPASRPSSCITLELTYTSPIPRIPPRQTSLRRRINHLPHPRCRNALPGSAIHPKDIRSTAREVRIVHIHHTTFRFH